VRIVNLESVRSGVAAEVAASGGQRPQTDENVLVSAKTRRRVRKVRSAQPTPRSAQRVADCGDGANPPTSPQLVFHPADAHEAVVVDDALPGPGPDGYSSETRIPDSAVHFAACENRNLLILDEPDPPAEIRNDVMIAAGSEREDIGPLDEERA